MKISRASVRQHVFRLDWVEFWHIDNRHIFTIVIIKSCQNLVSSCVPMKEGKTFFKLSSFIRSGGIIFSILIRKKNKPASPLLILKSKESAGNLQSPFAGYLSKTSIRSSIFIDPSNVLINFPFLSYIARYGKLLILKKDGNMY